MKTSEIGINFIKRAEGLRLKAYKDSVNKWTIGYGHTTTVTEGMLITVEQADELLQKDLARFERYVNEFGMFTQSQFDALVSLAFNVGSFGTNLRKAIYDRDLALICEMIYKYNKAGGIKLLGLIRRRAAEICLFSENYNLIEKCFNANENECNHIVNQIVSQLKKK